MLRIASIAAAAALFASGSAALAQTSYQSPNWNNSSSQTSYSTQKSYAAPGSYRTQGSGSQIPNDSQTPYSMGRTTHNGFQPSNPAATPANRSNPMPGAGQFANEGDARAHCGGDTVVWVNTRSKVYHLPGTREFGHTKHGAFMCRAEADRSGKFRAAKNERPVAQAR